MRFGLNKGGLKLAVLAGGGGCQPPCMPTGSPHGVGGWGDEEVGGFLGGRGCGLSKADWQW